MKAARRGRRAMGLAFLVVAGLVLGGCTSGHDRSAAISERPTAQAPLVTPPPAGPTASPSANPSAATTADPAALAAAAQQAVQAANASGGGITIGPGGLPAPAGVPMPPIPVPTPPVSLPFPFPTPTTVQP